MYRVISLDFWGTLAVFNPQYSAARTAYLAELFALSGELAHARYRRVKRRCDDDAERAGAALTPPQAAGKLIEGMPLSRAISPAAVARDLQDLARRDPPILAEGAQDALREAAAAGLVLGLASNTNFIGGGLIRELFCAPGARPLPLHFWVFSDEVGLSKPHPGFFQAVVSAARLRLPDVQPSQILHIGDNRTCDGEGARRAGLGFALAGAPHDTIAEVKRLALERAGSAARLTGPAQGEPSP